MKRRAFERWLRQHGARFHHHGASHDVWTRDGFASSVPRHREIRQGTARAICKQLDIPPPF